MNRVFIHIATLGHYKSIADEILNKVYAEGGVGRDASVYLGVVGRQAYSYPKKLGNGIMHHAVLGDAGQFEFPTLAAMQADARNCPNDNFLYLHTKGASTPDSQPITDWRQYMTYFCVERWQDCVAALEDHDCCGVDWRTDPVPHYSGNFWWAKGKYLASLPDIVALGRPDAPHVLSVRHNAEFWVGMGNPKAKSLWDCGINQYSRHLHNYPREKYANG